MDTDQQQLQQLLQGIRGVLLEMGIVIAKMESLMKVMLSFNPVVVQEMQEAKPKPVARLVAKPKKLPKAKLVTKPVAKHKHQKKHQKEQK
jgi:Na+-transporting methylmalonyl-CoA/oxaloacetate decarboxylase gamma subunit